MPLEWLLEGEAFLRYRVLRDLAGAGETDRDVRAAKRSIDSDPQIRRILDRQSSEGYWGTPRDIFTWWPKKNTTFWVLGMLADFGFERDDRRICRACEYVLSTQLPCGGFGWAPPPLPADCYTGILVESLAKLGHAGDPRVRQAFAWMVERQRLDGGFWCKRTGLPGGPREREPSCAFATLCVLGALALDPSLQNAPVTRRGVRFLLECWDNRGKLRYAGHDSQIGRGWEKLKYPFTDYRILKYLDTLSRYPSARADARIADMLRLMVLGKDDAGRFTPGAIHEVWSDFDFGRKHAPSRWITYLVYRIAKRLGASPSRG
jgi:hypothetical protein